MATRYSVEDQIAALNRHDPQAFAGFYAQDALVYDPQYPEPLRGSDAISKDMSDFLQAFPDFNFSLKSQVGSGDAIAFEGSGKGTHRGPLAGPAGEIPATSLSINIRFAAFLRLNDQGLIQEESRYYDLAGMMQQLGLMS